MELFYAVKNLPEAPIDGEKTNLSKDLGQKILM